MNIAALMKQAQKFQTEMNQIQQEMGDKRVEATAGGGMVTATANGRGEILSIRIDPETVKSGDVALLEDLVMAAVNEARRRSDEMMRDAMSRLGGPFGGLPFA
jgi:DNA-binding YbaB/EbfC family protein